MTAADSLEEARQVAATSWRCSATMPETIAEELRLVSSRPDAAPENDDEPDHLERGSQGWYDFLMAVASRRPTLVVIEDVHWAEPALLGADRARRRLRGAGAAGRDRDRP